MDIFDDLNSVCLEALGQKIVHEETGTIINGVFDYEYSDPLDVQSRSPVLTVQEVLEQYNVGDIFCIDQLRFKAVTIEPDGTGIIRIQLTRV